MAISAPQADAAPYSPARGEHLLSMLATAEVGGTFWQVDDPWSAPATEGADGNADTVAIAAIRGWPVPVTRAGRFGTPEAGPDREAVARHILCETRYRDPFSQAAMEPERAIEMLADWRRLLDANRDLVAAMGMAWWKRRQIRTFLWSGHGNVPRLVRRDATACRIAAKKHGAIAVWPSRVSAALVARAARSGAEIARVEDGFIRSVGLGSGLHPPFSVTVDRRGIHYDPSQPSDLEHLLETSDLHPALLDRARRLRATIVARGISKYGGGAAAPFPVRRSGRRLILVTGQVGDDLSVRRGGAHVSGNDDLLRRARAAEPEAEIWFRPHPDVDAGHRAGAIADKVALGFADHVVRGGSMAELFGLIDGLHVLTSLAGFEALLRGVDVTTHGTPFYAGWGLTSDLAPPVARRTRRLTLDALTAITLIVYPRYLDPVTGLPCPVETLVERFSGQAEPRLSLLHRLRSVQGRVTRRRL